MGYYTQYWQRLEASDRYEAEYGDFSGELEPSTTPLPHDTRYDQLRTSRTNFSQEVRQLGTIGLQMESLPSQPSDA